MELRIGRVVHYYPRISVAVLQLEQGLEVGETIHIQGHSTDLTQTVQSLEIDHRPVTSVGAGAEVALRVEQRVRTGDAVYRVAEARPVAQSF